MIWARGHFQFRHDWGQTLTELLDERFSQTPAGMVTQKSHHGSELNVMERRRQHSLATLTLISAKGKGHQWKKLSATRWASSANHVFAAGR
jgi:tRNA G37 N-methylase TrmD